ncbi:MAG TPA: diacylglycerol kinase family protein [Polyangiales bacterium]
MLRNVAARLEPPMLRPRRSVQAAVIVNANAGALRRNPGLAGQLERVAGARAALFFTRNEAELHRAARQIAEQRLGRVALIGGDGTASHTLTALWRAYGDRPLPAIALLRGGTMNTVARSLGVSPRGPATLLRRALSAWSQERPYYVARNALQVGDRLGFLFGTGLMYGWLAEYYARGDGHPTPWTAAHVFGSCLLSALVAGPTYRRIRGRDDLAVRFDGGEWESRDYITVGAGTVAHAGLGFRPFYLSEGNSPCFHLLAIKGDAASLARDLPSIWRGRGMSAETAYEAPARWAELRTAHPSFGYFVDGDLLVAGSALRLQLGPLFRVLCI